MRYKLNLGLLAIIGLSALTGCQTTTDLADQKATLKINQDDPNSAVQKADDRPFSDIISRHALANGVPVDLAHAVVYSESSYRPNARGAAGEIGLMQLRPATARLVGYSGSTNDLFKPETNIAYGMKYLGQAHELAGGDMCGTILKYNAGHGAKSMNPISQAYCNKVRDLLNK
ncbi:MAG: transglycosylase SLT domain-containing protein [Pseudomonadota bacterium]